MAAETTTPVDGVPADAVASDDNPLQPVLDFFDSSLFTALLQLTLFFFVALWLALVFWTFKDARRRIADPVLVLVAVATALIFPFVGVLIYVILRPPEYLDDVRERELEIAAAQARLANLEHQHCQYCGFEIEKTFLRCPSCLRRLKEPCTVCGKPLDPRWKICPYCEAEVTAAPRRRPARRAATPAAERSAPEAANVPPCARVRAPAHSRPRSRRTDRSSSAGRAACHSSGTAP